MDVQRTIRLILYSIAVIPLISFKSFYYGETTVKIAIFRSLIEVAFILALSASAGKVLISGLRKSPVLIMFLVWILALTLASAFGLNFFYSFWGDISRSWGIFTLVHIGLYFWLISLFFTRKESLVFFKVSLWTSFLVLLYGIVKDEGRIISTLGNPAYVAAYSLFNLGFGAIIYFVSKEKIYLTLGLLNLATLYLSGVRGSMLGLVVGVIIGILVYYLGWLKSRSSIKMMHYGVLVAAVSAIIYGALFFYPRFLNDNTIKTRFIGYNAGMRGFLEKPIFGWGHELFNVPYNKYFDPSFYTFSQTETYFDRAHNIFINYLATSGIVGTLPLIAFFAMSLWLCLKIKDRKIRLLSFGVMVAYIVHLQFLFEELISVIFFLALLAFVAKCSKSNEVLEHTHMRKPSPWLASFVPVILFNLLPFVSLMRIANANQNPDLLKAFEQYNKAKQINYFFPDREVNILKADKLLSSQPTLDLTIDELANLAGNVMDDLKISAVAFPFDDFLYGKMSSVLNFMSFVDPRNADKYLSEARSYEDKAIKLSPGRVQLRLIAAETLIIRKEYDEAIKMYDDAMNLNKEFLEAMWFSGKGYVLAGKTQQGVELLNAALDKRYKPRNLNLIIVLMNEMISKRDYKTLAELYSLALRIDPNFRPTFDIENVPAK